MEIEPFLITASLEAVLAQRLARVLCRDCRQPYRPTEKEMDTLGLPKAYRQDPKLFKPVGCAACDYRGYVGRTGFYELLLMDENVCDLILERAMAFDIRKYARKKLGMLTLREQGIVKAMKGVTSAAEVIAHTDRFDDD
jgi:type II secretory ATPase GspE/PulE/Tfp pilus assembly ATPase PilB-like protein